MMNLYKIAENTFKESLREPIFCVLLLCGAMLICHYPLLAWFAFGDQVKLVVDSSMSTALLFGLLAAVLSASNTVSREMNNGTVLLLMSKPVQRWVFVIGKIMGNIAAIGLFSIICSAASIIAVYMAFDDFHLNFMPYYVFFGLLILCGGIGMLLNFLKGMSFPAVVTTAMAVILPSYAFFCSEYYRTPDGVVIGDMVLALILIILATMMMATLSVVFAVRFDMVTNLLLCTIMFFLGLVSNYLFNNDTGSMALDFIYGSLYALIPNWQFFWVADALATNQSIPYSYLLYCFIYFVIFIVLASLWGVALFINREVAKDTR